jgi:hypothetical protein
MGALRKLRDCRVQEDAGAASDLHGGETGMITYR